ncbi:MAG: hypothetical protein OXC48_11995 [Endozoicomonadaceae bacterium]|nr:hypothetical protein [Endozoicomonadaceae bacterium]
MIRQDNTDRENNKTNDDSHKKVIYKDNNKLSSTTADNSSIWSNAFNFHKIWNSQVNPRTGLYTVGIKVGSLIGNLGHGPVMNLKINYSSDITANPNGSGQGWKWNLTHFSVDTNQLLTSQGQQFNLRQRNDGSWYLRYHKLKDIQITGSKKNHFVITYANGLREILNHKGCEVRLEQQNGLGINFNYQPGGCLLNMISDDRGHQIKLTRNRGFITVTSYNNTKRPVNVRLNYIHNNLYSVSFYDYHNKPGLAINLKYLGHLITNITYSSGLERHIKYNCTDAMKLSWQYDMSKSVCVVERETINSGAGQKKMVTHYTYQKSSSNEHNYLGFNAGLDLTYKSYQDTLFEASADYTYRTTEDNNITRQVFTYNRYHLLIDTKLISDRTGHLLSEKKNFFCRTDILNGCAHISFKDLPLTYSLPLKLVSIKWGDNFNSPAVTIVTKKYDAQGRIISETDPFGRTEKISYCPATGDMFCPSEPDDWSLSTKIESVISYPAVKTKDSVPLPAVINYNYYDKLFNRNNSGYTLALVQKKVTSGNQYLTKTYQYYNDKNCFNYGLLKTTIFTGSFIPGLKLTPVTKIYHYILSADHSSESTYSVVDLGSGQFRQSSMLTTNLFTRQILEKRDAQGKNITRYYYDYLGRLIQINSAADTPFSVNRYFNYTLSPQHNQLIITTENRVQKKVIFDGAGRHLMSFHELISPTGEAIPGKWLPEQSVTWDDYGRIASKSDYRINNAGEVYKLTSRFNYDDIGRINFVALPDGTSVVKQYDDANHCMASYIQSQNGLSSVISVIKTNILNKPLKKITLPAHHLPSLLFKTFCSAQDTQKGKKESDIIYDEFGRVKIIIDQKRNRTIKQYDPLGHVAYIINSAGDKIHNVYNINGQVTEKWIQPHNDNKQYLLSSAKYNAAGELLWYSGEDGKKTNYRYNPNGKITMKITQTGHIISWDYNMQGLPVKKLIDGKVVLQTEYNPVTLLPEKKTDITGTSVFTYADDKKREQLVHMGKNGYPDYHLYWQYNKNREIISATDFSGHHTLTQYDQFGRISSTSYTVSDGKTVLLYVPAYDSFSRISHLHYGSGMERTFHYNNYGQQDNVKDTLRGKFLSEWKYNYDAIGNITRLEQNIGSAQQGVLNYQYDVLNNLVSMTCTGSFGLPLCPRDTSRYTAGFKVAPVIIKQNYKFNNLNRIRQVKEVLISQEQEKTFNKITTYDYGDINAPLRLQKISIVQNNKTTKENHFIYDKTGNMLIDGEGNKITYNIFNQIIHTITLAGKQADYTYDGNNREASETISGGDKSYMFYISEYLLGEKITDIQKNKTHVVRYLDIAKTVDGIVSEYYERDYKRDIAGVLTKMTGSDFYTLSQRNIYSPYGMVWHCRQISVPLYQQTLQGFNKERTDPVTGWQFLGAGHRTYNPAQRYFVSEDPYGDGYAFCSNNPVMNTDPDGNIPKWIGTIFHFMDYTGTLGLGVMHKKWISILGSAMMAGLNAAIILLAAVTAGSTIPAVISQTALWGGMSFISPVVNLFPASKALNAAGAVSSLIRIVKLINMLAVMFYASRLMLALSQLKSVVVTQTFGAASDFEDAITTEQTVSVISQNMMMTQGNTQVSVLNNKGMLNETVKDFALKSAVSRTKKMFSLGRTPSRVHNLISNSWFAIHTYTKKTFTFLESELANTEKQNNIISSLNKQDIGISAGITDDSQSNFMGCNDCIMDDNVKTQLQTISKQNFLQAVQLIELQPHN